MSDDDGVVVATLKEHIEYLESRLREAEELVREAVKHADEHWKAYTEVKAECDRLREETQDRLNTQRASFEAERDRLQAIIDANDGFLIYPEGTSDE